MARLRANNISSFGIANPITFTTGSTTTGTWTSSPGFATITGSDYYVVIVEPDTTSEEIVYLTAFTAGNTSGTFTRAQEGSTGIAHSGKAWIHGPTALDIAQDTTSGDITTSAVGDAAAAGTNYQGAAADHRHGREGFGTPGSSAVGDSASAGSATTIPRSDHVHGREAFGTPGSSAVGDTVSAGSATTDARSDHRHGREAFATPTGIGTSNSAGSATTIPHSDHVHAGLGQPIALTGATAATRYVGGTTSGPPSSGTFAVGDFIIDQTGLLWICVTAGSPGKWTPTLGGRLAFVDISTPTYTTSSTSYVIVDSTNAKVTFVAPASGNVLIRVAGLWNNGTAGVKGGCVWSTSSSNNTGLVGTQALTGSLDNEQYLVLENYITGLTAGNSTTLYLQFVNTRGGAGQVQLGEGVSDIIIEVIAL